MRQVTKGIATGVASGIVVFATAIFTLARTNALVLPAGVPLIAWETLAVFGLGVTAVALVIHVAVLALAKPNRATAFVGFILGFIGSLVVAGLLQTGIKALIAAAIGALIASGIMQLRSNNSSKPMPLRGTA